MYYNKTDKPASVDPAKFGLDKTDKVEWPPLKRFTVVRADILSTSLCQSNFFVVWGWQLKC